MAAERVNVVGAGPNGLAAAAALVRANRPVTVYEAMDEIGGGTRSAELTEPGYVHDICSAVHPLGAASPFFRTLPLALHGLEWVHPPTPLAHPFDDGTTALLERSAAATGATLDAADSEPYRRLMEPLVARRHAFFREVLAPPVHWPRRPLLLARFARDGLRSATGLARAKFRGPRARALFAGIAAHGLRPLDRSPTAAIGLVLAVAGHAVGWPIARGGSQRIAEALGAVVRRGGGEIVTGSRVRSLDALPPAAATLLNLTPRQVLDVAGDRLPARYGRGLAGYRYGPGVFKIDWALSEPIPWRARSCGRAATVHLGGTAREIAASAAAPWTGAPDRRPFVILAQPSLFDPSRAPEGRHTAWAYCHVPHGSTADRTAAIEAQVERFAPGFRDVILSRSTMTAAEMERHNPNLVGGDINGGVATLRQLVFRPVPRLSPYTTPAEDIFLCSASTPPGGGVHGMCGYHAARAALRRLS